MSQVNPHNVVIRVSFIAALAGLLFGLDVAYVNGALNFIISWFESLEEYEKCVELKKILQEICL